MKDTFEKKFSANVQPSCRIEIEARQKAFRTDQLERQATHESQAAKGGANATRDVELRQSAENPRTSDLRLKRGRDTRLGGQREVFLGNGTETEVQKI
jgi:hypothetical protein